MSLVLDGSTALAWCFEDEATPVIDRLFETVAVGGHGPFFVGASKSPTVFRRQCGVAVWRCALPLATLDQALRRAAAEGGVALTF